MNAMPPADASSVAVDAATFRWSFFPRRNVRDDVRDEQELWTSFVRQLRLSIDGLEVPIPDMPVFPPPATASEASALYEHDWHECSDGQLRAAVAHGYLDSWFLRTGVARLGAADVPDAVRAFTDSPRDPVQTATGSVSVFTADVNVPLGGISGGIFPTVFSAAAVPPDFDICVFEWGGLAVLLDASEPIFMLLAWNTDQHRSSRDRVHDVLLPSAFLALTKYRQLLPHYETCVLPSAHAAEARLQPMRAAALEPTVESHKVYSMLIALAPDEAALLRAALTVADYRTTIEVNAANMERAFRDPLLREQASALERIFCDRLRLLGEQMRVDGAYIESSVTHSRIARDALRTRAALDEALQTQRTALFEKQVKGFGVVLITLEIIQSFSDHLSVDQRLVLLGAAVAAGVFWLTFKTLRT